MTLLSWVRWQLYLLKQRRAVRKRFEAFKRSRNRESKDDKQ